ncbi:hypothetical protein EDM56_15930 [Brevibacillus fluminis]|uniref:Xylose isomerase-like TIM barrel domain-containing protein n=1 Tax=Brevibacillus fluminis TaxID=511487 RepID=A0A3M8DHU6_9BACL|nr:TIM barrel protein [Brevibacillus fluminis]RNB87169.1 hypothetical protein EDM56_15930 [Brevibacillus fluminis]
MTRLSRSQITGMNFHYIHYPLAHFLDAMSRLHVTRIELWGAEPHCYVEELGAGEIRAIRQMAASRGLSIVCFTPEQCMYPINLAAAETEWRERSIRYFEKSIAAATELESPYVLVTPGWGYRCEPAEEAWKRSRDSLERLAHTASGQGVTLALEPLTPVESNLVNDAKTLGRMLQEISSPQLKGMLDTIPMAVNGESIQEYFQALAKDLVHIHFVDGNPDGHLAWGDGNLPLASYLQQLEENGYAGSLSLEFTSARYWISPDAAVNQSLDALAPYMG